MTNKKKNTGAPKSIVPVDRIENSILLIRGQKVMLDYDLADLYSVPTRALKQAVRDDLIFIIERNSS